MMMMMRTPFDTIPCLKSDTILLKQLTKDHAPALLELTQDQRVYRYLPTYLFEQQYTDPYTAIRLMYEKSFPEKETLHLGIFLRRTNEFCGIAELYGYRKEILKISLGYRLLSRFWGRGIATNTVSLLISYLYSQTNIEIITASTMIENIASARVLEKNGFLCTARRVPEDWGYPQMTLADKWFR